MSEAPLAPTCPHCGATNQSDASKCWFCGRRDWRPPHVPRPPRRLRLPAGTGCGIVAAMMVFGLFVVAQEMADGLFLIGRALAILGLSAIAAMIALATICSVAM